MCSYFAGSSGVVEEFLDEVGVEMEILTLALSLISCMNPSKHSVPSCHLQNRE